MSRTALVLGGGGMLGHQVVAAFGSMFDVHATVRNRAPGDDVQATLHRLDAMHSEADLDALLSSIAPELVVNCIGIVKQLAEGTQPIPSIRVNSLFPHEAAAAAERHGARFIHVSTDCVFAGSLPFPAAYTEDDPSDAADLYGRTKFLGEVGAPALTLRTSIIGRERGRATGLLEWFLKQEGATVAGFSNAWFSGLTTPALARIILRVATQHPGLAGLYHVSTDPISKFDLLKKVRDVFGVTCEIEPADEPHLNRILDSTRFRRETGVDIPSWDEMLSDYGKAPHLRTA